MGLISSIFRTLFGGGRNIVRETAEVFVPNAEAGAQRAHDLDSAAMAQLAAEFGQRQRGWFDRLMDGVNRLPRPLMVVGLIWMLVATARDPVRMAEVFAAWAVLPEAAWIVFGVVVTFYFGGRQQVKDHEFQRDLAGAAARAGALGPDVREGPETALTPRKAATGTDAQASLAAVTPEANEALADWERAARER